MTTGKAAGAHGFTAIRVCRRSRRPVGEFVADRRAARVTVRNSTVSLRPTPAEWLQQAFRSTERGWIMQDGSVTAAEMAPDARASRLDCERAQVILRAAYDLLCEVGYAGLRF